MGFLDKPSAFEAPRARAQRPPPPGAASLSRVILLAVLVAIAAGWAAARHYSKGPRLLNPPAAPVASPYDEDAGELAAPEIIEGDAS